jgi:hypothetical protein
MLQKISQFIPATTLGLIYCFVCGGCYQLGYWTTFDFDISGIISITDIPKSFIYPFFLTNIAFLIHLAFNDFVYKNFEGIFPPAKVVANTNQPKKTFLKTFVYQVFADRYLLFFLIVGILFYYYKPYSKIFWVLTCVCFSFILTHRLTHSNIMQTVKSAKFRIYISYIVFWFPILAFLTGKMNGIKIHAKEKYQTISRITVSKGDINPNTLINSIFLGFLGDKIILQSPDNSNIVVLNQSSVDVIYIKQVSNDSLAQTNILKSFK